MSRSRHIIKSVLKQISDTVHLRNQVDTAEALPLGSRGAVKAQLSLPAEGVLAKNSMQMSQRTRSQSQNLSSLE